MSDIRGDEDSPSHRKPVWISRVRRLLLLCVLFSVLPARSGFAGGPVQSVPLCSGITFTASYLAVAGAEQGPGFRFTLLNNTSRQIQLAEPVPSSAHWYARSKGRWLWRASNGAGGGLLDAGQERGRVVVYPAHTEQADEKFLIVLPHQSKVWIESPLDNPVLAYQPGCRMCSYPGENEYQVVFAYAYLDSGGHRGELLPCGLRSKPVPMPPKF